MKGKGEKRVGEGKGGEEKEKGMKGEEEGEGLRHGCWRMDTPGCQFIHNTSLTIFRVCQCGGAFKFCLRCGASRRAHCAHWVIRPSCLTAVSTVQYSCTVFSLSIPVVRRCY